MHDAFLHHALKKKKKTKPLRFEDFLLLFDCKRRVFLQPSKKYYIIISAGQ